MDSVRAGPFGQLFRPDNFVFGQTEPVTTGRRATTQRSRVDRLVLDVVRKEAKAATASRASNCSLARWRHRSGMGTTKIRESTLTVSWRPSPSFRPGV